MCSALRPYLWSKSGRIAPPTRHSHHRRRTKIFCGGLGMMLHLARSDAVESLERIVCLRPSDSKWEGAKTRRRGPATLFVARSRSFPSPLPFRSPDSVVVLRGVVVRSVAGFRRRLTSRWTGPGRHRLSARFRPRSRAPEGEASELFGRASSSSSLYAAIRRR